MAAHGSQSIGEGGLGFGIPGGGPGGQVMRMQGVGAEHGEAEEASETGGGAGDGGGGPLSLGLEPEMRAEFLKGDLNGMIANDKACVTRWSSLRLSWWRRPLRLRGAE